MTMTQPELHYYWKEYEIKMQCAIINSLKVTPINNMA